MSARRSPRRGARTGRRRSVPGHQPPQPGLADGTSLAIDLSWASGADAMLVSTGPAEGTKVQLNGATLTFKFLITGAEPRPQAQGDRVVVGEQTVALTDGNLVLRKMAGPWKGPSGGSH